MDGGGTDKELRQETAGKDKSERPVNTRGVEEIDLTNHNRGRSSVSKKKYENR